MTLDEFNALETTTAHERLFACCASTQWCKQMLAARPFSSEAQMQNRADTIWRDLKEPDFLEAFDGHPKIGDPDSLKAKYAVTHASASFEQSGMQRATEAVFIELADLNERYLQRFGFIFIVCATGKTADQMLQLIRVRVDRTRQEELLTAAEEQRRITAIRIGKLLD